MPPRTACGPVLVRREARFDTGWRLHVLVDQTGRSHDPEEIGSARSNRAGDTRALVAHLAERPACNWQAAGSIPAEGS